MSVFCGVQSIVETDSNNFVVVAPLFWAAVAIGRTRAVEERFGSDRPPGSPNFDVGVDFDDAPATVDSGPASSVFEFLNVCLRPVPPSALVSAVCCESFDLEF